MASVKTRVVVLNDTNEIRIRLNEWKGATKVYIQSFFKPGENDNRPVDKRGFAHGKAATLPMDCVPEFDTAWNAFYADWKKQAKTSKKAKGKAAAENTDDEDDL